MKLTTNQKIWTGVGSFALLLGSIIGIKKYKEHKNNSFNPLIIPPTDNVSFPLKYGDKNSMVKRLQKWINKRVIIPSISNQRKLGISKLEEDGEFGDDTFKAVKLTFKTNKVSKSIFNSIGA